MVDQDIQAVLFYSIEQKQPSSGVSAGHTFSPSTVSVNV